MRDRLRLRRRLLTRPPSTTGKDTAVHTPITREELLAALEVDAVTLVEALPAAHYDAEHLPGAVNVTGELSPARAAQIAPDIDRPVVVYCSGPACGRSKVTAAELVAFGYTDVRVYAGGKADWFAAGLPLEGARVAS